MVPAQPYHYLFAGAGLDMAPAPYLLDGGGVFKTPPLILAHSKNGKGEASRRIPPLGRAVTACAVENQRGRPC